MDGTDMDPTTVNDSGMHFDLGAMWRQMDESALIEAAAYLTIANESNETAEKVKEDKSSTSLNINGMYYAAVNPKLFVGAGAGFSYMISGEETTTTPANEAKNVAKSEAKNSVSGMNLSLTLASFKAVL
jgi:hypothetical protein